MQGSSSHPASGVSCSMLSPYLLSNKNKGEDLLLFNKCHSTSISLIYTGGMGGSRGGGVVCSINSPSLLLWNKQLHALRLWMSQQRLLSK